MNAPTLIPNLPPGASRSNVRVKAVAELVLFVSCAFLLNLISMERFKPAIFLVAALAAVAPYFIRCETCKSRMKDRAIAERNLLAPVDASGRSPGPSSLSFLFAARCPYCGMGRI